jgi:hypothetical protein
MKEFKMNAGTMRWAALVLTASLSIGAHADPPMPFPVPNVEQGRASAGHPPPAHAPGPRVPSHYDRSRYYPPYGHTYAHPPRNAYEIRYRSRPYYYHGGSWYHHDGTHFVVIAPPIGIVAPFLPPYYSTFWVGGYPYYYANDVYYAWRPAVRGYVVVEPPAVQETVTSAPASDLFVYPAAGQSMEQQATDRYECHAWAVGETGFDPVQPQGGVDAASWSRKREDYQRALAACLVGRGYSVK